MQFDVIFIFKWNVAPDEHKDFIQALDAMLCENGIVYITAVEENRFHDKEPSPRDRYWVRDVMEEKFWLEIDTQHIPSSGYYGSRYYVVVIARRKASSYPGPSW